MPEASRKLTLQVRSNGPYISCEYYQILTKSNVDIIWHKFDGLEYVDSDNIDSNNIDSNNVTTLSKPKYKYKRIELGVHPVTKNDLIDIKHRFSLDSKTPARAITIGNKEINPNQGGTSSDFYELNFDKSVKYKKYNDSFVDH